MGNQLMVLVYEYRKRARQRYMEVVGGISWKIENDVII